jgi:hypothetical protein
VETPRKPRGDSGKEAAPLHDRVPGKDVRRSSSLRILNVREPPQR